MQIEFDRSDCEQQLQAAFGGFEGMIEAPCEYSGVCIDEIAEEASWTQASLAPICTSLDVTPLCPSTLILLY